MGGSETLHEVQATAPGRGTLVPRKELLWTELTASALLFLYPLALLPVRGSVNVCFTILVATAFWRFMTGRSCLRGLSRGEIAYMASMASLVAATALSEVLHWRFRLQPFDGASRFLLAVPVFLMLRSFRQPPFTTSFKAWQYGVPLGAIASALIVLPQLPLAVGARASISYLDPIRFGDLALALSVLSATSTNRGDSTWLLFLKAVGAAAGLFASIASGTRGGWIALPIVALIWWSLPGRSKPLSAPSGRLSWWLPWRRIASLAATLAVLAVLGCLFVDKIHERLALFCADVVALSHSDLDTPLGLRLQVWRAAIRLFVENPVFGIGPDEFGNMAPGMHDLGLLTDLGVRNAIAEVHSEILVHTTGLGIFGLASIVSIHAVPLVLFIQAARSPSSCEAATAGVAGACFVAAFLIFGTTVEILNLKMTATFYSLTVAVLLSAAMRQGEYPQGSPA